nr:4,5-DOPA dioxygenase extradiol [Candidatus Njordarchaeum guaymaensis]
MVEKTMKGSSKTEKMPVLFIGHGSPMNIILENNFTDSLKRLGKSLPRPKAIMVVSAHWLTSGTRVTCMDKPTTIYDFYGFPSELYKIKYPSPGAPEYARMVERWVRGVPVYCDPGWGLDHATWSVLRHMYPRADIPVFEMSLDYSFGEWHPRPIQYHYDLAKELLPMREKGVLIIGSGNIVHNLRMVDFENIDAKPYDWAIEFDEKVKSSLLSRHHENLIEYQSLSKNANMAAPTLDHYLPMIYAVALQGKNESLKFTYEGFHYASVSMRCFQIG